MIIKKCNYILYTNININKYKIVKFSIKSYFYINLFKDLIKLKKLNST